MRYEFGDSTMDLMIKLSEGNPGALMTCMELFKLGPSGVATLLNFDDVELYGDRIYMIWNDCCHRDVDRVVKVMNAWNAGKLSKEKLLEHVSGVYGKPFSDEEIEVDDELSDVFDGEESNG